jgi:hypothetical protein
MVDQITSDEGGRTVVDECRRMCRRKKGGGKEETRTRRVRVLAWQGSALENGAIIARADKNSQTH